jgi:hypothetical protein
MGTLQDNFIKHREITFRELHPDPNQAQTAALFLADVEGVIRSEPVSPLLVRVSYDLLQVTLEEVEEAITEIGLHIDDGLLFRIRRALHFYSEETQRANLGCSRGESNCTTKVFAVRYRALDHSCRDHRPEHWRRYL